MGKEIEADPIAYIEAIRMAGEHLTVYQPYMERLKREIAKGPKFLIRPPLHHTPASKWDEFQGYCTRDTRPLPLETIDQYCALIRTAKAGLPFHAPTGVWYGGVRRAWVAWVVHVRYQHHDKLPLRVRLILWMAEKWI